MARNIPMRPAFAILRRAVLLIWLILVGAGLVFANDDITEEVAEEATEDSVEDAVEDSVEATVEDSVEATVEDSVEATVEDSVEATVEDSVEATVEDSVEATVEDSVEATVEDSVEATVESEVEDSVEEAVESEVEDSVEEAVENEVEDSVEEAVENEVEDEVEEAIENEVEDEAEEAIENEVEDEAEEAIENEVEDEAEEAIENEGEDEAEEAGDDALEDFDGPESEDYDDDRHSEAEISGQLYAELEEIGQRDFVVSQELLALADATQIQQLTEIPELTLISKQSLGQLTGTLARFRVDASQGIDSIRSRLQRLLPAAAIDFNHGYEIAQTTSGDFEAGPGGQMGSNGLAGGLFRLPAANRSGDLKIGMVDTDVDTSHSVFDGTRIVSKDFLDPGQQGSDGHGTAVASLLVGRSAAFQGMLPNTDLYAASVFSRHPEQALVATSYGLVRALEWLSEMQVDAINISLAGPANMVVARAMNSLTDAGVLVVAAVGNEGPFAEPRYPAAYRDVVGVTAIDRSGRLYSLAGRGEHVDYAGPGVAVTVAREGTGDGFQQNSGTSFATPIVTGLLLHYLSAGQMRMGRLDSAVGDDFVDLGKPGRDSLYGYGLPGRAWIPDHLRPSQ